jgi:hypothetical protein
MSIAALILLTVTTIVAFILPICYKQGDNKKPGFAAKPITLWMLVILTCVLCGFGRWYYALVAFAWLMLVVPIVSFVAEAAFRCAAFLVRGGRLRRRKPKDFGLETKKVDYL